MTGSRSLAWQSGAACRDVDPELFFPAAERGPARRKQVRAAKAVCAECPVREECLDFALEALSHGVAGGLDEHERRALRKASAASGAATIDVGLERATRARRSRARGRTVSAIAAELGVSIRTVERWTRVGVA